MNCSNVPIEIKNAFDELKSLAVKYGVRTKRGSKQAFCKKIWGRIEDYLRLAVQSGEVSPRDVKDIRGLESVTEASSTNKGCIARDCTQNRMAEVLDLVHHGYVKYSNNEGTNPVLRCTNQVQKGGVPPDSTNPPPKDAHVPPTKPTEEKLATNLPSATSQAPQKSAFPSAASSSSATMTNNNNDDTLKPPHNLSQTNGMARQVIIWRAYTQCCTYVRRRGTSYRFNPRGLPNPNPSKETDLQP